MDIALLIALGLLIMGVLLVLQVYSFRKLKRQTRLMQMQGQEIEKQMRELQHQNDLLTQLNEEKQRISSIVSHDLKGPFNRIFALGQLLLLSSENFTAEQKEYLSMMHQIVADGLNMLRNLLDYRRLEEKGIQTHAENLNITAVVRTLVKNYSVIADKKKITIHFHNTDPLYLVTDKTVLGRITDNLLSNAIKFSPPEKEIVVTTSEHDGVIHISFKDQGPGLSVHDQGRLFQKYQHLTPRPTGGETTTGLGLYLAREMADKIRGEIQCSSKEGEGSIFTLQMVALEEQAN